MAIEVGPNIALLLKALASALTASVTYWLMKRRGTGEPFRPRQAFPTLFVSFLVALGLIVSGQASTQNELVAALPFYVGPIVIWLQGALKRYLNTTSTSSGGFVWVKDRSRSGSRSEAHSQSRFRR